MMLLLAAFCFGDMFPFLGWLDKFTGLIGRLKATSKELDVFLDLTIEEHLDEGGGDKKDLLHILLQLRNDGTFDIELTQDNLKAILLDMFLAGTDTTSTTIEWVMAELAKNPRIMKKAQEEVRNVVGKKATVDQNDISQMDYLKCVIKEALRLHAPVPFLVPRETTASDKMGGYDIPANTRVFINAWAIQRDPKVWDIPEEFQPERFQRCPVDFKDQEFRMLPFGGGRRICPGISFGTASVECVVANLLYWFDWKLPGGAEGESVDTSEVYGHAISKKLPLHLVPILHCTS